MAILSKFFSSIKKIFKRKKRKKATRKTPKRRRPKTPRRPRKRSQRKKGTKRTTARKSRTKKTSRKKSPSKKARPKKGTRKIPSKKAPKEGPIIGEITHFFNRIQVVVIKVTGHPIRVGEQIRIKGPARDFTQPVKSLQIESVDVKQARKGQLAGLKVKKPAKPGDKVYKSA